MNIAFTNTQKRSLRLLLQLAKLNLPFKPTHLFYTKARDIWNLSDDSGFAFKDGYFGSSGSSNYYTIDNDIFNLPSLIEDTIIDIREFY